MYSPLIIKKKAQLLESLSPLQLKEHSLQEVDEWLDKLKPLVHPDSTERNPKLVRNLREDEAQFVQNEIAMCKISYPYWATRYAYIKKDKGGMERLKFWESQDMLLSTIGKLEENGQPILIINLKARQVGASTLSETIMTHKVTNNHGITSLVSSDEPSKSEFLFNMMGRVLDNLPFYLKPHRKYEVKGTQLVFDQLDSHIFVDSGNKRSGGIGQGMTVHCGHLSELATWNNPEMVTEDLLPAVLSGASPNTFFILESTAKGRSGSWYDWWKAAKRKRFHGFIPVFIPWWAIKEKYAAEPILGWTPSDRVMKQYMALKQTGKCELTRKQMYWWDQTYMSYKEEDRLDAFFAEYASDDNEAFQLSGRTVFDTEKLNDLLRMAKTHDRVYYELQSK